MPPVAVDDYATPTAGHDSTYGLRRRCSVYRSRTNSLELRQLWPGARREHLVRPIQAAFREAAFAR